MWQYTYSDELYHYGVLGMKWGVHKNPAKAYAKGLKVQAKKKNKYEKANEKSVRARSDHKKSIELYKKLDEGSNKSKSKLDSAKNKLSGLENTDTSLMRRKDRKYFNKMVDDARMDVNRKTEALTKQRVATSKALDEARTLNKYATRSERKASRRKNRLEKYTSTMNKAFKDLDAATIAEGRALFEQAIKKNNR